MNVYDFDNTIYDGDSSIDFYFFVLKKKPSIIFLLPKQLYYCLKYLFRLTTKEKFKEAFFSFLKQINNIDNYVAKFWIKNNINIKAWYLTQKRVDDVIISASPHFLLQPICNQLGIKYLIASNINSKTGKHIGKNCHGDEKVIRYKQVFKNKKIATFYTDSLSDKPLINIASKSFIVRKNKIIKYEDYRVILSTKIKNLFFERDFIIFIFCGGMGTLSNFIVSLIISKRLNPTIAYICGYMISIFITYYLNIKLIFKKKIIFVSFLKFIISYIPNFLILLTFVSVFLNIFYWNKILVYGLAGLLGIPVTFVLVKLYAFRKNN